MAYKYFLDFDQKDAVIDTSLLSKFRTSRINDEELLEEILAETVRQAIDKVVLKSKTIIVNATHTKSKSNSENLLQILRKASRIGKKNDTKQKLVNYVLFRHCK